MATVGISNTPIPPPLTKPVKMPPPIPMMNQPSLPKSIPQQKEEPTKPNNASPGEFNGDHSFTKETISEVLNARREYYVSKEQAQLDKLEIMLFNLNTAIHAKSAQQQQHSTAVVQPQTSNANNNYQLQPGLNPPKFKSSKKRKREEENGEEPDIEALLKRRIPEEEISFRDGGGGKQIAYLDNYTATKNAVEILGHDGWSDEILSYKILVGAPDGDNKFQYEVMVIMRMYLENGCYRDDFGFGKSVKASRGEALASALKAGATMARKRLWRLCGDYMGNCLYDKKWTEEVHKRRKLNTAKK